MAGEAAGTLRAEVKHGILAHAWHLCERHGTHEASPSWTSSLPGPKVVESRCWKDRLFCKALHKELLQFRKKAMAKRDS